MSRDAYHHAAKSPEPGAPLIFAFHGTGADESQFAGLITQLRPDAGFVAPRGDVSENGGNRFFRRMGEGVYDMDDLALRTVRMADFIAAHKAAHPDTPVFGLGYSNGANILASVLFDHPALFDRTVLMHPLIPWTPPRQPGLAGRRILITAGRHDPICPLPMTKALETWFADQGAQVELVLQDGGHDVAQAELSALKVALTEG